jgi:predicted dehydrogenase
MRHMAHQFGAVRWSTDSRSTAASSSSSYGSEGGAELIVRDMEPIGSLRIFTDETGVAAETTLSPPAGTGHNAVVAQFVDKVRNGSGDDGSSAAELARVVDACYRSAAKRREVRLDE